MIRRHAQMGNARLQHAQQRPEDAARCRDLTALGGYVRGQREMMPEKLVSAVDEVDIHARSLMDGLRVVGTGLALSSPVLPPVPGPRNGGAAGRALSISA